MTVPTGSAGPTGSMGPTGSAGAQGSGDNHAPVAPGRLGQPIEPTAALVYIDALGRWRDARKAELDQLDQAALHSPQGAAATGDIMLSMALWKAASDRYELLLVTWDSGRVGVAERERLSSLIWGRLDATLDPSLLARSSGGRSMVGSGLAVSLPEACRLSDALLFQLRERLGLDPSGAETTARIRGLRAQMERIREQVLLEPAGPLQQQAAEKQSRLASRLAAIVEKAGRGGDVGGMIGPFEIETATFERDLIVDGARRREAGAKVDTARALVADLESREAALRQLVARCVSTVEPAPRYAVPDVEMLGPIPNLPQPLDAYLQRLGQVSRAMTLAQDTYATALAEHSELVSRLEAYAAKATALRIADDPELRQAYTMAKQALDRSPTRMPIATQLVSLYQSYLTAVQPAKETT